MIISLIKYFVLCISDIYIFTKILNYKKITVIKVISFIAFSSIISYLVSISKVYLPNLRIIIMILLSGIFMSLICKKKIDIAITTMFISYGISYTLFMLAIALLTIAEEIFIKEMQNIQVKELPFMIASSILQFILCILFFRIKRFKYGFSFMNNIKANVIGFVISITIIICIFLIESIDYITSGIGILLIVIILFCAFGIIYWWLNNITNQYIDSLKVQESEVLKNTILERDQKIEKLTHTNEFLSSIVHKDNHLIPAMQMSVQNLLQSLLKSDADTSYVQETQDLLEQLNRLSSERDDSMVKEQIANKVLPTTKVALIDGVFCHMLTKAIKEKIELDLTVTGSIRYMIDNIIPQTSLETLIADHIKDAIIAINAGTNTHRRIFVHLGIFDGCYEFNVKDSGIPFEIDTLLQLGERRVTTHSDTGGSGIGFMTTFKTMKETGASLIIAESTQNSCPYVKTVRIRFDQKNEYIIQSFRYKEIKSKCKRSDIIIQKV